jgi:hypothetical protein
VPTSWKNAWKKKGTRADVSASIMLTPVDQIDFSNLFRSKVRTKQYKTAPPRSRFSPLNPEIEAAWEPNPALFLAAAKCLPNAGENTGWLMYAKHATAKAKQVTPSVLTEGIINQLLAIDDREEREQNAPHTH